MTENKFVVFKEGTLNLIRINLLGTLVRKRNDIIYEEANKKKKEMTK